MNRTAPNCDDSVITKDKATIGRILTDNGYHTAWFGKNHNTPEYQASQAGPFDQWPNGLGFEYFYGFMGGEISLRRRHRAQGCNVSSRPYR
jgi:arylsulfatase A-like enzyme